MSQLDFEFLKRCVELASHEDVNRGGTRDYAFENKSSEQLEIINRFISNREGFDSSIDAQFNRLLKVWYDIGGGYKHARPSIPPHLAKLMNNPFKEVT